MFSKVIDTGSGIIKISTRFVGQSEQVLISFEGRSGNFIVDSSALLSDQNVADLVDALKAAIAARRFADISGAK